MAKIIPAILTNNLETFQKQIKLMEGIADMAHIDVCDGVFVPEKTLSAEELAIVNTPLRFSVHLMVQNPTQEVEKWYKLPNISQLIFQLETTKIPAAVIEHIEAYGLKAGLAINPATALEELGGAGFMADMVLFLSVPPGKQGQPFNPEVIEKIRQFKITHPNTPVAIDGGVHLKELEMLKGLGLDYIIMGSEIFTHSDPAGHFQELQKLANEI